MVFFPKGFTDADYASVYCTSVSCELDEGDPNNPDKITSRAFASVKVKSCRVPPRPRPRILTSVGLKKLES
jgi:hypothetical protein